MKQLHEYSEWAEPLLRKRLADAKDGSADKLHLSLALVGQDDQQVDYLYEQLLHADAAQFPVIRSAWPTTNAALSIACGRFWRATRKIPQQQRLRAAGALATYDPQNAKWNDVAAEVAGQLVAINPAFLGQWQDGAAPGCRPTRAAAGQDSCGPATG